METRLSYQEKKIFLFKTLLSRLDYPRSQCSSWTAFYSLLSRTTSVQHAFKLVYRTLCAPLSPSYDGRMDKVRSALYIFGFRHASSVVDPVVYSMDSSKSVVISYDSGQQDRPSVSNLFGAMGSQLDYSQPAPWPNLTTETNPLVLVVGV